MENIKINFTKDGNKICATLSDFIDLQESPAGFGDSKEEALVGLIFAIKKENEKLLGFLDELRNEAQEELKDIEDCNCYGAGYEVGKIDVINEIKAFVKNEEYDFGKDY